MKTDLHLHSKFSDRPSEWFLQRLGTSESYTEPDFVYDTAIQRGMDFVTITDHNKIDGAIYLKEKYPYKVFTGVEVTTYFPEDGCKIHLLIYGLDESQFESVQHLRENIYKLRDYIKKENLAYSVAHATYAVNNRLNITHIEKLILLFDVFEGINGSRSSLPNQVLIDTLANLTPDDIERLYKIYNIEPFSDTAWVKGLTGGSDDHAGIFIAKTYTEANVNSIDEFLDAIRTKKTICRGRENNFQGLAFAIYKIAYEFSKTKSSKFSNSPLSSFTEYIFEKDSLNIFDKFKLSKFKSKASKNGGEVNNIIADLVDNIQSIQHMDIEDKLDILYDKITDLSDSFIRMMFSSLKEDLKDLNIVNVVKDLTFALPGIFLFIPFFSSFRHMFNDRNLAYELESSLGKKDKIKEKKILWFTDTINDLNGVSKTLQTISAIAEEQNYDIYIVASLDEDDDISDLSGNIIIIPPVYSFSLPFYKTLDIKVPSLLKTIKEVYKYNPDEIYISTPGPMGLAGLLIAKLLKTTCSGIFHTDFSAEIDKIAEEPGITELVEGYVKWFFTNVDTLLVPSYKYINILEVRGYDRSFMKIFRRGIKTDVFAPEVSLKSGSNIKFLYTGRISQDKNLDFLIASYLIAKNIIGTESTLTIVGDGPYLEELKDRHKNENNIIFTGKVDYETLPSLYSASDLFLFPSITDTFGMVVLEAQACGLPAIVSDRGGPQEIIEHGSTGLSLPVDIPELWAEKIAQIVELLMYKPDKYNIMRLDARKRAVENFNWDEILKDMVNKDTHVVPRKNDKQENGFMQFTKFASKIMAS